MIGSPMICLSVVILPVGVLAASPWASSICSGPDLGIVVAAMALLTVIVFRTSRALTIE